MGRPDNLHHYYSWGSVTSILYNTIAIIFTWLLITLIRSDLQKKFITCGWGVSIISLAWFMTFEPSNSSWQNYMKFDKNITSRTGPENFPLLKYIPEASGMAYGMNLDTDKIAEIAIWSMNM